MLKPLGDRVVIRVLEKEEGNLVVGKLINVALRFLGLSISNLGFVYEDRNMVKAVKKPVTVKIRRGCVCSVTPVLGFVN